MSQLSLVTHLRGNEAVTDIIYNTYVQTTDFDPQNIL